MRMSELGSSPADRRRRWRSWLTAQRLWDEDFAPVFICGASGSGTTLIASLLNQNYEVGLYLNESVRMLNTGRDLWMDKADEYPDVNAYYNALFIPAHRPPAAIRRQLLRLYRREIIYPKTSPVVIDKGPNAHLVRFEWLRSAFPAARFVFLFRQPVESVEGLRRKWKQVFGGSPLTDLCDFWLNMHERFLEDSADYRGQVYPLAYDTLVADPPASLARVAAFARLTTRPTPLPLPDRPAKPGKGLRNVVDGKIVVMPAAHQRVDSSLTPEEELLVAERLLPAYTRYKQIEAAFLAGQPQP